MAKHIFGQIWYITFLRRKSGPKVRDNFFIFHKTAQKANIRPIWSPCLQPTWKIVANSTAFVST
jgi:hypothetical protein